MKKTLMLLTLTLFVLAGLGLENVAYSGSLTDGTSRSGEWRNPRESSDCPPTPQGSRVCVDWWDDEGPNFNQACCVLVRRLPYNDLRDCEPVGPQVGPPSRLGGDTPRDY